MKSPWNPPALLIQRPCRSGRPSGSLGISAVDAAGLACAGVDSVGVGCAANRPLISAQTLAATRTHRRLACATLTAESLHFPSALGASADGPAEPANTLLPSASVIRAAFAVLEPSFAR